MEKNMLLKKNQNTMRGPNVSNNELSIVNNPHNTLNENSNSFHKHNDDY